MEELPTIRELGWSAVPSEDQRQFTDCLLSKYYYFPSTAKSQYVVRPAKVRQIPRRLQVVPTTDLSFHRNAHSVELHHDFSDSPLLDLFRLNSNSCSRGPANLLGQSRREVVPLEKRCESLPPRRSERQAEHHREIEPNGFRECELCRCPTGRVRDPACSMNQRT